MGINNLKCPFQFFIQILIQNLSNPPLTLTNGLIGYVQHDISLIARYTKKFCIKEVSEFMNAYIAKILANGTSQTLKELYFLNLTKQQEREYK